MGRNEELLRKIAEGQAALKELEELQKQNIREYAIKNLEEYTEEEKIKFFDKMYKSALDELNRTIKDKYHDDDCCHYVWEEYIEILARDKKEFWKFWNSIND